MAPRRVEAAYAVKRVRVDEQVRRRRPARVLDPCLLCEAPLLLEALDGVRLVTHLHPNLTGHERCRVRGCEQRLEPAGMSDAVGVGEGVQPGACRRRATV